MGFGQCIVSIGERRLNAAGAPNRNLEPREAEAASALERRTKKWRRAIVGDFILTGCAV
jgi:hypothetical protein